MKEHLYGIVLFPAEQEDMEASWDEKYGQITVEGDEVAGNGLAEYAAQYTAEDGWEDVTRLYNVEEGTAYMFEKAVEVAQEGTRYVRVFVYATTDESGDYLATEGIFYITAYDPYVYEWPAEYLAAAANDLLSSTAVPSVTAQHYYVGNYGVTAYYTSDKADGGYGAILTAAGFTVEQKEGYYSAVSPDGMYALAYLYKDGALEISMRYVTSGTWPQTAITSAFNYYQSIGATAFTIPAFEGDDVIFMFSDGYYNKFWVNEGKQIDMYGTITVAGSTQALTTAYIQKLVNNGWSKLGDDGIYMKPIADSEEVNRIKVTFDAEDEYTLIDFYYLSIQDPTRWSDNVIKKYSNFYKYLTDTVPEYTGTITAFTADKDSVYITVPEADFAGLMDAYKLILVNAGFVLTGTTTWSQQYVSPNAQYGIKLSTPSSKANTLCLYMVEQPTEWNNERIKDYLQSYGSTLESIPMFESEKEFLCSYSLYTSDWMIKITAKDSSESMTQEDANAYKTVLLNAGWTQDPDSSSKFISSDGKTTITVSYSSYSGVTINIKSVA